MGGVILLLPNTRRIREFLAEAGSQLRTNFPLEGRLMLDRLGRGENPEGSGIVVL